MQKFVVGIEEVILKKFETFAEDEYEAEELAIRKYFGGIKPLSQEITSFIEKHDELINNLKKQKQLGTKFPNCMSI